ncbi:MAG: UDP-N-acetylmuramoyl-L-alanyl-D-glutamate--2,6-diaminopimelate ligase, partial [Micromonosporaceae bacterium]
PRAALGGCAAAVYGDPTARLTVLGITGTAGKTSTAYLVDAGLRAAGTLPGLIGTVETRLGDDRLTSERTTPEAPDLQALFAVALERGLRAITMEVSSHALTLHRVAGTRFAVGAFTNLGMDHLDFHADLAEYFAAKAMLFDGRCAHEVVNLDDPAGRKLVKPETVTVSAAGDPAALWRAGEIRADGFRQRFRISGPDGLHLDGSVNQPGVHNVGNALIAVAMLAATGVDPEVALRGIAECAGVPGRMERVSAPGPVRGVVDYAHKPDAVVAVLTALRPVTDGRLICVIGAGGDRDRQKRPMMGEAAARHCDLVVVTDDNPRDEDPAAVRAEVLAGTGGGAAEVVEVAGRRTAIEEAVRRAGPGDTVVLLGKGHEQGQEVAGEVHPFDDRVELAAALTERFGAR